MKYVLLVCEGISDEPLEELTGRTPLEVAKTPNMDLLAKQGASAQALFTPGALPPSGDVAAMSLLGFDPEEFYTGIAPLEAIAMGIPQLDHAIAFRCNLVSVLDETLIDAYSGNISLTESVILIKALNQKLSDNRIKFYTGAGFRNLLLFNDAELSESLDELECASPRTAIGQRVSKSFPKGHGASAVIDLMNASKEILDNHEINKVRIDLGENPANMIWLWGQGKKPKISSFKQRYNLDGSAWSKTTAIQGLAQALGFHKAENAVLAVKEEDFVFVYHGLAEEKKIDLTSKIKHIEEFDASVLGPVLDQLKSGTFRICVAGDYPMLLSKKIPMHGQVPVLFSGNGIASDGSAVFNEKTCLESKLIFNHGHKLMEYFLKS